MTEGALFIAWGSSIPGRETAALDVFKEANDYFEGLRKKGDVLALEPIILSHVGGPIEGFFLLRGDPVKLATLTTQESFRRLTMKTALVCKNVMVVPAFVGTGVTALLETYRQEINALALQHQHV